MNHDYGQFGILCKYRRIIERYCGIGVILRSTDESYEIIFVKGNETPGLMLPKVNGTVSEDLFNGAIGILDSMLKEGAA